MKLTNEQMNFLAQHEIPLDKVFDATGMKRAQYASAMKSIGASIAIGVTPCGGFRHTMRNRSGHCVVCTPMYLTFQKRHEEQAQIYVASSKQSRLVKIGIAKNVQERLKQINYYGYGGINDWEITFSRTVKNAGRVEAESQKLISNTKLNVVYERDGESVDCREIFNCDTSLAIQTVKQAISIHG
jgi:hypothetical protein